MSSHSTTGDPQWWTTVSNDPFSNAAYQRLPTARDAYQQLLLSLDELSGEEKIALIAALVENMGSR